MNWEMIGGIVRHVATFGGGFLVTSGALSESEMQAGVGALVTIIGLVWSLMVKRKVA